MEQIILIRYGELMTKGDNKKTFQNRLLQTVSQRLKPLGVKIIKTRDRIYIENIQDNFDQVNEKLQTIFGIHSYSLAWKIESDINVITKISKDLFRDVNNTTMRVRTKRSDKSFPLKSMEVSKIVSREILTGANNLTVDLNDAEHTLLIEIRKESTFLMFKTINGAKGYPTGSVGKGLCMLSGGIDSPVAAHLAMKRGVNVEFIHFASPPYTSDLALQKVLSLAKIIAKFSPNERVLVHVVPFTSLQMELNKHVTSSYQMTIMRRMMYRITERIANRRRIPLIINGECLGQVASQTPESMVTIHEVISKPIISPVIAMDKLEIIEMSKQLNLYETSILPYEDCCTIFVPKSPAIYPKRSIARNEENKWDWQSKVEEAINNIETYEVDRNEILSSEFASIL